MKFFNRIVITTLLLTLCFFGTAVGAAADSTATHESSSIYVNGDLADIDGYNIKGNNYFKLRDLAKSLTGTEKNFQVEYDEENNKVVLTPGSDYEPDGTENYTPEDPDSTRVVETVSEIYFEGEKLELTAYNVNGYNYVKLRDVAELMDFALMYYAESKNVIFATDKTYEESEDFPAQGGNDDPGEKPEEPQYGQVIGSSDGYYTTQQINAYSKYFTNLVDGYRIMVPEYMSVDTSISEFRTVLRSTNLNIEIYRQTLGGNAGSYASYVNYGNKFINNGAYTRVYSGTMTLGGHSCNVLEWYRAPLARVVNDKCYYASVDMKISNDEVLTFLFKSSKPFSEGGTKSYISILNTFQKQAIIKQAQNVKKSTVENLKWNAETKNLYDTYFSGSSKLTWGIFDNTAPFTYIHLNSVEQKINAKFKFLVYYTTPNTALENLQIALTNAAKESRTLELTFQTLNTSSGNMVLDILNGKYDDYLNQYAKIVAASEKPVLFRLCNEMNGDWCVYSAYYTSKDTDIYVEMYQYIHKIFEQNGALKNTIWVWNPNERSFPYYDWNHALCYYPGDEYVDVVGMTGYNTGTYYSGETWRSFAKIYDSFYYQYCAWFSQPLMITEFACSSYGGDKAQWVRDMFVKIKDYSRIKVAIWWSGCDYDSTGKIARAYFIDDDDGVIEAFRKSIGSQM